MYVQQFVCANAKQKSLGFIKKILENADFKTRASAYEARPL